MSSEFCVPVISSKKNKKKNNNNPQTQKKKKAPVPVEKGTLQI